MLREESFESHIQIKWPSTCSYYQFLKPNELCKQGSSQPIYPKCQGSDKSEKLIWGLTIACKYDFLFFKIMKSENIFHNNKKNIK